MHIILPLVAVVGLGLFAGYSAESPALRWLFAWALPYLALLIFIIGVIAKVVGWAKVPVPFGIATTCGQQKTLPWIKANNLENPHNLAGVLGRMFLEVVFFRSLFRNTRTTKTEDGKIVHGPNRWLWGAGLIFHYCFLFIVFRHLRFFTEPVPTPVLWAQFADGFFELAIPAVYLTSLGFVAAVTFLFVRRVISPQLRYISLTSDYFPLFLLLGIGTTGILLRHFFHTDIMSVKEIAMGIVTFSPVAPEGVHPLFYSHLFFVCVLMAYFPFSKLMHMAGVFMSPTRNLQANTRERRHVNPWGHKVKVHVHSYEDYEKEFGEKMRKAGIYLDADDQTQGEKKEEE